MAQELLDADQKILENTRSLCQQLSITNYNPVAVAWSAVITQSRGGRMMAEMPFDEVVLMPSQIIMPAAMRGKLEPDEWKPIIASVLIASKKFRKQIVERVLLSLAIFAPIAAALFLTLPMLFPQPVNSCTAGGSCSTHPLGAMISYPIAIPILTIGTAALSVLLIRKLKLKADLKTGELLGTTYFLQVLNKIASMMAPGQADKKPRGSGLFPSLNSRIQNLQNGTLTSTAAY